MRAYIKCLSLILVLVSVLSCVSIYSAGAESEFVKPEKFIYGDVDMDGVVTVKDATAIQKGLAGLEYLTAVQRYLADPNGEGVTVKSATAIQKHIAGLGDGSSIDEFLEMKYKNKFSNKIEFQEHSCVDHIIVQPINPSQEYTLEDFSEYDFCKIEVYLFEFDSYPDIKECVLYLSNPGKENVEEAIRALDYRANLDLKYVSVATYDVPL